MTKKTKGKRTNGDGGRPRPAYFLSLELENVRCFGPRQKLDLSDGNGRPRQWTVILGDNGVGKTTLLQALAAMAPLMGSTGSPASDLPSPPYWRNPLAAEVLHTFVRSSEARGQIRATIAFGSTLRDGHSFEIRPAKASLDFDGGGTGTSYETLVDWKSMRFDPGLETCLAAYGATRRMSAGGLEESPLDDSAMRLFDEERSLPNAAEWFLQMDYAIRASKDEPQRKVQFQQVRQILLDVLPEVKGIRVVVHEHAPSASLEVETLYGWVPMRRLGLGYRTMIAWTVDLARRLWARYPESTDPLAEPAVALVDEIDLHLHPQWQRRLLAELSKRFPNVQFIVTAHSPLVVQTAEDVNLVVLRAEGDHVIIDKQPDSVRGWRVDQILTSDLFGLPSARPAAYDPLLAERERLLTKARITKKDKIRLRTLEEQLGEMEGGETRRDWEAMDFIRRAAREMETDEPER